MGGEIAKTSVKSQGIGGGDHEWGSSATASKSGEAEAAVRKLLEKFPRDTTLACGEARALFKDVAYRQSSAMHSSFWRRKAAST